MCFFVLGTTVMTGPSHSDADMDVCRDSVSRIHSGDLNVDAVIETTS